MSEKPMLSPTGNYFTKIKQEGQTFHGSRLTEENLVGEKLYAANNPKIKNLATTNGDGLHGDGIYTARESSAKKYAEIREGSLFKIDISGKSFFDLRKINSLFAPRIHSRKNTINTIGKMLKPHSVVSEMLNDVNEKLQNPSNSEELQEALETKKIKLEKALRKFEGAAAERVLQKMKEDASEMISSTIDILERFIEFLSEEVKLKKESELYVSNEVLERYKKGENIEINWNNVSLNKTVNSLEDIIECNQEDLNILKGGNIEKISNLQRGVNLFQGGDSQTHKLAAYAFSRFLDEQGFDGLIGLESADWHTKMGSRGGKNLTYVIFDKGDGIDAEKVDIESKFKDDNLVALAI